MGTDDLVDEFYLERALIAAQPVCRISIRSPSGHERGCATGFMISPRLLLTNEHVFGSADEAEPSIAEFNYRSISPEGPSLRINFGSGPSYFFSTMSLWISRWSPSIPFQSMRACRLADLVITD
jgi:endonuclease G